MRVTIYTTNFVQFVTLQLFNFKYIHNVQNCTRILMFTKNENILIVFEQGRGI